MCIIAIQCIMITLYIGIEFIRVAKNNWVCKPNAENTTTNKYTHSITTKSKYNHLLHNFSLIMHIPICM